MQYTLPAELVAIMIPHVKWSSLNAIIRSCRACAYFAHKRDIAERHLRARPMDDGCIYELPNGIRHALARQRSILHRTVRHIEVWYDFGCATHAQVVYNSEFTRCTKFADPRRNYAVLYNQWPTTLIMVRASYVSGDMLFTISGSDVIVSLRASGEVIDVHTTPPSLSVDAPSSTLEYEKISTWLDALTADISALADRFPVTAAIIASGPAKFDRKWVVVEGDFTDIL